MCAGRAKARGDTAPLVVGTEDGPGRPRCNWIGRVMVPFLLPTPAHGTAPCFPRGKMSDGCKTMVYCVVLSLALILVVKFLGRGGHIQQALESLSIGNGLSRQRTSQHTHTHLLAQCLSIRTSFLPGQYCSSQSWATSSLLSSRLLARILRILGIRFFGCIARHSKTSSNKWLAITSCRRMGRLQRNFLSE